TNGHWRAGALMLQRVPPPEASREAEAAEDGWRRALAFMASARNGELTDPNLAPDALLYRLLHEPGARVFRAQDTHAGCRCSRERVERMLRAMPADELTAMQEEGEALITCEFCNRKYCFDRESLASFAA